MVKLEVGKRYQNLRGDIYEIVEKSMNTEGILSQLPYCGQKVGSSEPSDWMHFTEDGFSNPNKYGTELELITEIK